MHVNDPFYFALAPGQRPSRAIAHIAETFGVKGRAEHVRRDGDLVLCRLVDIQKA